MANSPTTIGRVIEMPKKLIPMVLKPSVRPIKYYDIVGDLMMKFLSGRKVTVIRQVGDSAMLMTRVKHEDGSKLPIILSTKDELIKYVKLGGVDFMASVNAAASKGIDMVIIDIKGGKGVWMSDRGLELMDLLTTAVRITFEQLGLVHNAVIFDGMNGFKVISMLSREVNPEDLRALVDVVNEVVHRSMKSMELYQRLGDDVVIGGNTMLKVRMYRVPLSLHWSTKLSAIPVARVYDFTTISADPSNVIRRLDSIRKVLEPLFTRNPVDALLDGIRRWVDGDYSLVYQLKGVIRSSIMGARNTNSLEVDRENLKT